MYYVQMTSSQFVELAQLCPDHNEIGSHLLSMAKSLSSSEPLTTQSKCTHTCMYLNIQVFVCDGLRVTYVHTFCRGCL